MYPIQNRRHGGALWSERFLVVDGIRTHVLEAGEGRPVVLLHSGEHGGSARFSWDRLIPAVAERYRVVAPDWLGFGETDKLHDFEGGQRRRVAHLTRVLETLDIGHAAFVGSSMGGTILLRVAAMERPPWDIAAMVVASGGGFIPDNEARQAIVDYDCTVEGMRRIVAVLFHDPRFSADDDFVAKRHRASIAPGAWEAAAAARLRNPLLPARSEFGRPDDNDYSRVRVPVLLVAGEQDPLRLPGYAADVAARMTNASVVTYPACGHLPNEEHPDRFAHDVLEFLDGVYSP